MKSWTPDQKVRIKELYHAFKPTKAGSTYGKYDFIFEALAKEYDLKGRYKNQVENFVRTIRSHSTDGRNYPRAKSCNNI